MTNATDSSRVVTVDELKKRVAELIETLDHEEKELLRHEDAVEDLWVRGIEAFLDGAVTHRFRVLELKRAIDSLNKKIDGVLE